jgi:hypothetical protein
MRQIVSFAASLELIKRPDAELLLTKPQGQWDVAVIRFATRKALEAFNVKANLNAVVKTPVPKGCVLYRHQREQPSGISG